MYKRQELGLEDEGGVVVLSVRNGSTAASLGFKAGDIIARVGGADVESVVALEGLVRQRQRSWQMTVKRGGRTLQLQVPG